MFRAVKDFRARDLAARIRQWQRQVGDECPLPSV
jgi:hypothetical protein